MIDTFPIVPRRTHPALWGVVAVTALALVAAVARAGDAAMPVAALLAVLGVAVAVLFALTLRASRTARFEVSPEGLRLRGDLYARRIPADRLRAGEARAVDLTTERALQPWLRTFGTAIPGYAAGWFRLNNRERALLYLTDRSHVAYVPTTEGYVVLLSVADPAAFVASLRRAAAARA